MKPRVKKMGRLWRCCWYSADRMFSAWGNTPSEAVDNWWYAFKDATAVRAAVKAHEHEMDVKYCALLWQRIQSGLAR